MLDTEMHTYYPRTWDVGAGALRVKSILGNNKFDTSLGYRRVWLNIFFPK